MITIFAHDTARWYNYVKWFILSWVKQFSFVLKQLLRHGSCFIGLHHITYLKRLATVIIGAYTTPNYGIYITQMDLHCTPLSVDNYMQPTYHHTWYVRTRLCSLIDMSKSRIDLRWLLFRRWWTSGRPTLSSGASDIFIISEMLGIRDHSAHYRSI